jgi:hypothetical protein
MNFDRLLRYVGSALQAAVLLAAVAPAHAATHYVAANGVDAAGCGVAAQPCRSISWAIWSATAGDVILVGPGRYGDLDGDGVIGEPGEEIGVGDCPPLEFCPIVALIRVNKAVTIISSRGAASTVIDGRSVGSLARSIVINGGEFGRPGKGFTVTNTKYWGGDALVVDGANVKVRGNQVVSTAVQPFTSVQPPARYGISVLGAGPVSVEGNQVIGQWQAGIYADGPGKTIRRNQVSVTATYGIYGLGNSPLILGNIVTGANAGILLQNGASAIGNSVTGGHYGIVVNYSEGSVFTGAIQQNNIVDNRSCGLSNELGVPGLNATNNYWGAASGPGPDPADQVCNGGGGSTIVTPFLTKPFSVSAPIKP